MTIGLPSSSRSASRVHPHFGVTALRAVGVGEHRSTDGIRAAILRERRATWRSERAQVASAHRANHSLADLRWSSFAPPCPWRRRRCKRAWLPELGPSRDDRCLPLAPPWLTAGAPVYVVSVLAPTGGRPSPGVWRRAPRSRCSSRPLPCIGLAPASAGMSAPGAEQGNQNHRLPFNAIRLFQALPSIPVVLLHRLAPRRPRSYTASWSRLSDPPQESGSSQVCRASAARAAARLAEFPAQRAVTDRATRAPAQVTGQAHVGLAAGWPVSAAGPSTSTCR